MIATGCAAGCAHAVALIFDGDLPQETADQLSEMRMMTTIRRLMCRNFSIDWAIVAPTETCAVLVESADYWLFARMIRNRPAPLVPVRAVIVVGESSAVNAIRQARLQDVTESCPTNCVRRD